MKLLSLFSGGKDSTFATYLASRENKISYLLTIESKNKESYMFHTSNIKFTKTQAKLMNIPIIYHKTKGEKEDEIKDLEKIVSRIKDVDGLISGTIASNYQRSRIDAICSKLSLIHFTPLWKKDSMEILNDLIKNNFKVIITSVAAYGFDIEWLGKEINFETIKDLEKLNKKYSVNLCGEGGEFETFVLDCPLFKKRIEVIEYEKIWDNKTRSGEFIIKKIKTFNK